MHYPALLQIQSNNPCHSHYCFYWPHHCIFTLYRYTLGNTADRRLEHFSLIHSSGSYLYVFCSLTKGKYHLSKSFLQLTVPIPTHWNLSLKYSTDSQSFITLKSVFSTGCLAMSCHVSPLLSYSARSGTPCSQMLQKTLKFPSRTCLNIEFPNQDKPLYPFLIQITAQNPSLLFCL